MVNVRRQEAWIYKAFAGLTIGLVVATVFAAVSICRMVVIVTKLAAKWAMRPVDKTETETETEKKGLISKLVAKKKELSDKRYVKRLRKALDK